MFEGAHEMSQELLVDENTLYFNSGDILNYDEHIIMGGVQP